MNDFDFDVKEKKNLARGAYHRKRGSKSKKCTLPSDLLTAAQKRALNGPVSSVKLGEPILWPELKRLDTSLRKEYLNNLLDTYHVSATDLGRMLGVSDVTVYKELKALGLKASGRPGKKTKAQSEMWAAFCKGVVGGSHTQSDMPEQEKELEKPETKAQEAKDLVESHAASSTNTTSVTVSYDGIPTEEQLSFLFHTFVQQAQKVAVTIELVS